ncbi:MAG: P-II family nitrogen regulator [Clostridia bacterium]|nr:P-II family nitrogen regulator [Clostridia bacterium]
MAYEVVFCIVNAGYSDIVMDAAKEVGARGGTVIHARGTANKEAEQLFQITIQPDKEIVMILVPSDIKDAVLHALYRDAGLKTAGQGIAFSLPVDDVVGLSSQPAAPAVEDKPAEEEKPTEEEKPQAEEKPAEEDK